MTLRKIFAAFLSAAVVATSAAIPVLADEPTTWDEVVTAKPDGYVEDADAKTIEISSAEGLAWFSHESRTGVTSRENTSFDGYTITLTKNIDISAHQWVPISQTGSKGIRFSGTFDGENHTISGLTINSKEKLQGLFKFSSGTIKNLTVSGSVTINDPNAYTAGGIVAQNSSGGVIENCHNKAAITGYMVRASELMQGGYNIGGITGKNSDGTIIKCSNSGIIKGSYSVGGIVGTSTNSTIQDSYNTGDVMCFYDESLSAYYTAGRLGTKFGGIVGGAANDLISNCYNTGNVINDVLIETWLGGVNQNWETGGIAGSATKVKIQNCYNGGDVTALGKSIGGIIGDSSQCTLSDSYNDGQIKGLGNGSVAGAIVGSIGGTLGSSEFDGFEHLYYKEGSAEKGIGTVKNEEFDKSTESDDTVNESENYEELSGKLGDDWTFNEETGKPESKSNPVDKSAKKAAVELMTQTEWEEWIAAKNAEPEEGLEDTAMVASSGQSTISGESQELYIVAEMADDAERVLDFATLEFELFNSGASTNVTVEPAEGMALERSLENKDIYTIHVLPGEDAEDGVVPIEDGKVIGKIIIGGYGSGVVQIRNAYVNKQVADSVVREIQVEALTEGEITEKPGDDTKVNYERTYENTIATAELTINVMFPNTVEKQSVNYTDMTISLHSALDDKEPIEDIKLGSELKIGSTETEDAYKIDETTGYGQYTVKREVLANTRYTIKFEGKGYRTYSVDVVIPKDADNPSVTVWNNVMDQDTHTVVTYDGANPEKTEAKTFLAGDIIEDNTINLYDLSAAVAYFGKTGMTEAADKADYIKYDLNRDGAIDSKDIAMVLVSWNK